MSDIKLVCPYYTGTDGLYGVCYGPHGYPTIEALQSEMGMEYKKQFGASPYFLDVTKALEKTDEEPVNTAESDIGNLRSLSRQVLFNMLDRLENTAESSYCDADDFVKLSGAAIKLANAINHWDERGLWPLAGGGAYNGAF